MEGRWNGSVLVRRDCEWIWYCRRSGTSVQAGQAAVRHTLALCFPGERASNVIGVAASVSDRGVRVRLVVSAWYRWEVFRSMSWSLS